MITPTPRPASNQYQTALLDWYEKTRPMLIRIGIGILGASGFVLLDFATNGLPFALAAALFSVLGARELYRAVRKQGGDPNEVIGCLACIVFQISAWEYFGTRFAAYLPALLVLLVIISLLAELGKQRPKPVLTLGTTLLGAVYVGWLFSFFPLLHGLRLEEIKRGIGNQPLLIPPIAHTTPGEWLVLFVVGSAWLSDAGALFVGRSLGRHKLAPNISPAKTWEGSIGGLICSVIGGCLLGQWLHLPLHNAFVLALLCGISGQVGDLCESALKRDLEIKDFGGFFPGHGGVLDRIDSLLFAAPLAYYTIRFFLF